MKQPLVAVAVDLDWPGQRHIGLVAGIRQWMESHPDWDIHLDEMIVRTPIRNLSRYAGVIARATPALAKAARRAGVPIVNVWHNSPVAASLSNVFPDWAEAGREAASCFQARGFLSLACVFPRDSIGMVTMADAFRQASGSDARHPVATFPTTFAEANYPLATVSAFNRFMERFGSWVTQLPRPLGILVSFPDSTPRYICHELHHLGLRVPEDVAIIAACHEPAFCDLFKPTISGVNVPFTKVGYEAAARIDALMKNPGQPPRTILVPPQGIIARDSTSVFPVEDDLVKDVLLYIDSNLDKPLEPSDLAARMLVTRRTLDRHFHDACGRSVSDVIRGLRIDKARQLLATTDLLVKQVALEVGIRHPVQLHYLFQKKFGVSPSEYRRQVRPEAAGSRPEAS